MWLPISFIEYFLYFFQNSETPVVEKEVVEVDAPKVVDEENEAVKNGNSDETVAPESAENGAAEEKTTTEEQPAEEVTSAAETDGVNGDSIGKWINWLLNVFFVCKCDSTVM